MGVYLADALRRRLARQEADGDTEGAKLTEKRLKAAEKAEAAQPDADPVPEPKATPETVAVKREPAPKPKTTTRGK